MNAIEHVYLHTPFCRNRCPYCDYAVSVSDGPALDAWCGAVGREFELRAAGDLLASPLATVLVGGGTPSLLGAALMPRVAELLGTARVAGVVEWTGEANPEDLDIELVEAWQDAGVTRVNVGAQSFRTEALQWLGRSHQAEEGREAVRLLARSGLPTWGVDILYGLPPQVDPNPLTSVEAAVSLGVPHISLYELVSEPDTPLGVQVSAGRVRLADDDSRADQYLLMGEFLRAEGYEAYEATAFALEGHGSRHAISVLEGRPFLALGPGAHSYFGGRRCWNLRDWPAYSMAVARGDLPVAGGERADPEAGWLEKVWSGLRLARGIPFRSLAPESRELGHRWTRMGWAHPDSDRIRLTFEGWLRLDELALELARMEAPRGDSPPGW